MARRTRPTGPATIVVETAGTVAPGFEPVRDAFEDNFRSRGDVGAALAVYRDGELVVDLAGGRDPVHDRRYTQDTLQLVFSTTKGLCAVTVLRLAADGALALDRPVADYWPAFGVHGKDRITVADALAHRTGISAIDGSATFEEILDPVHMAERIAAQAPRWTPGTSHGYHTVTFGWIVDGLVRAVTGRGVDEVFRSEVAEPLGLDAWIGLPADLHDRVAPVIPAPPLKPGLGMLKALLDPRIIRYAIPLVRAMNDPASPTATGVTASGALEETEEHGYPWNRPELWATSLPAGNGIATARALARLYASCVGPVDGVQTLHPASVTRALREHSFGPDDTSKFPSRFGPGFHLHHRHAPLLSDESFGHGGMGGSNAFADRRHRVGYAYVMNQMFLIDDRSRSIVDALRDCLD